MIIPFLLSPCATDVRMRGKVTAGERENVVCGAALRRNAMQNSTFSVQRDLSADVRRVDLVLLPPVSP
jgi:hypothetical protein